VKLATLEGSTGREVRRELLGHLLESTEADAALWYDVDGEGTIVGLVRLAGQTNVRYLAMLREHDAIELRDASALSMSEHAVAEDLAASLTIREIAASRGRAESTVKSQAKSLYRKLGVASRVELVEALR
jgi:DNA-binding NarL/FixJ family response regulator